MKTADVISYSVNSLSHRQTRFWLTILGVVIGIASVVALLTMGQAFNAEVNKQLSALNGNTIYILPIAEAALQSGSFSPTMGFSSLLRQRKFCHPRLRTAIPNC